MNCGPNKLLQIHEMNSGVTPPAYRWQLLAILWVCFFLHQGDRQIFNSLIPLLRSDLKLDDIEIGLVASIFTMVYGLLVPFAGFLGDYVQKGRIVTASLLIFSIGTLFTGFAGSIAGLILCRSVATGAGESFYYPAASSLISQHHVRTRSLGLALHQGALYFGVVASGWLAGWVGQVYGWRVVFFGFGGVGVLWSVVTALLLWKSRPDGNASHMPRKAESPNIRSTLGHVLSKPTFYCISAAFAGQVFVNVGYTTWMATFLHENYGLTLAEAGFHSTFWHFLAAAPGVIIGAQLADRLCKHRPAIRLEMNCLGLLLGAPCVALLALSPSLNIIFVGLAAFGFFRGIYDSNVFATLFDIIEPRYRSTAAGLMLSVGFIAGATAPVALGWIKTISGLESGLFLLAVVFAVAGLMVLAARHFTFASDRVDEAAADSSFS